MIDAHGWAWALLVAGGWLQVFGHVVELGRTAANPTARPVHPWPADPMPPSFVLLEMPGQLAMLAGLWLLHPDIGWTATIALWMATILITRRAGLAFRDERERTAMEPFDRAPVSC
ncbi:hypothetical protein JL107_08065 [Nakamurella flavida]|uniref:Uncharacterized protein n=1 Tax=Nakamurella flavida TaxID=363630 RepID=A0A938YI68_9ACTN|nr:hypothetical protein [Nakamurella flavida]MBM9476392.1 hypothetical protein [Nakamurella flavida]MDP9779507.1 hypothetical protein [Nakamurella flavida]